MNINKFAREEGHVYVCPFCKQTMPVCDNEYFKNHLMVGYECPRCSIPNANTISGKPFSRYNIGIFTIQEVPELFAPQVIVEETFYIHAQKEEWYNVSNKLTKEQTALVLVTPTTKEINPYLGEKPVGLTWVGGLVILPFIDSWDLSDEAATINKIKTYLLFL